MKRHFLTGLAILLPIALTIWIIQFLVDLLTDPFLGVAREVLQLLGLEELGIAIFVSKIFILIFLFSFIIAVGSIARQLIVRYVIRIGDSILHRIPVISSVYKTSQELVKTIFTSDNKAFKQVVLVPFPNKNATTIGLLTRDDLDSDRLPVFIPTTPNPTSGYLIMYDRSQVTPIEMSVETAFRYIVSCGVLIEQDPTKNGLQQTNALDIGKRNL